MRSSASKSVIPKTLHSPLVTQLNSKPSPRVSNLEIRKSTPFSVTGDPIREGRGRYKMARDNHR